MAGIKRKMGKVYTALSNQLSRSTDKSSVYAKGLAREGFTGGYLAALEDVQLALNGVEPRRWRDALELDSDRPA